MSTAAPSPPPPPLVVLPPTALTVASSSTVLAPAVDALVGVGASRKPKTVTLLAVDSRTVRLMRRVWPWLWRTLLFATACWIAYLLYLRRKRRARQKNVELSYALFGTQVRFGLDIGGTLSKVVYFEPECTSTEAQSALKERVSNFIRRSHSYGVTGRRDSELEVSLHPIKGTLHFVKFQTSMMPNFITIVKENELAPATLTLDANAAAQLEHNAGEADELSAAFPNSTMLRRNTHTSSSTPHHHHHHVFSHAQLPPHPSHSGRSYSAAWRSEDEFRQQYLNAPSAPPADDSTAIDSATADTPIAVTADPSAVEESPLNTLNSVVATANHTSPTGSVSITPIDSVVAPLSTAADERSFLRSSASASKLAASSNDSATAASPPAAPVAASPTASAMPASSPPMSRTISRGSSRGSTPSSEQSLSCPSSPLAGAHRHTSSTASNAAAASIASEQFELDLNDTNAAGTSNSNPPSARNNQDGVNSSAPKSSLSHRFHPFHTKRLIHSSPIAGPIAPSVCATGGGAFKFDQLFRQELGIALHKQDELRALVKGIDFMIHTCRNECYYLSAYRFREPLRASFYESKSITYPYLVVNIGSGVSILKVSGPTSFERVGGTSLGGGTFYGLCRALTGCTSFEEALKLAEKGRAGTADLLVGDIYGGDYTDIGLGASTVAASFGKLVRGDALKDVRKEDLAKAALVMITNNIGSLANLYARKVLNVPQMIFVGNFLNQNDIAKRGLAFATEYWSQGTAKALFLTHEGYFGAVGSLLGDK